MAVTDTDGSGGVLSDIQHVLLTDTRVIFFESAVLFLLAWHGAVHFFDMVDYFSSPVILAGEMYEILFVTGAAWPHLLASSRRIVFAFIFSMFVGTALGVIMGITKFWRQLLTYYVTVMLAIPGLFAAVFAAMWFGLSDLSPMVATALLTSPLISITIRESVQDVDANLIEMSGSFGVSRRRVITRVILRSIAPAIFGTARYAFSVAWKITNLTEVIIADTGIGWAIRFYFGRLDTTGILKYVLLFSLIVLFVEFGVIRQIEKRAFAHRESVSIGIGGGPMT